MRCKRCSETPGFHSFEHLCDVSGTHYFYCYPAHNTKSVRTREDMLNFARHFPEEGEWSLLFHAKGYGLASMMPLPLAIELGRIVQEKHLSRLRQIYIVEGTWFFTFVIRCVLPFLRHEMREKFVLLSGSLLEVCEQFQEKGLSLSCLSSLRANFCKVEP
jgi:hypothetical protein